MQKRIFGTENEYSFAKKFGKGGGIESESANILLFPLFQSSDSYELFKRYRVITKSSNLAEKRFWLGSNGGLFYFDYINESMFPEYSTPECDSVKLCVAHDKAGEIFVNDVRRASAKENKPIFVDDFIISKNTTIYSKEEEGAQCVGCHENYLADFRFDPVRISLNMSLPYPVSQLFCNFLTPFLISRVIIHGAGGIRWSRESGWHYVISQRAFAIKKLTGSETLRDRTLIQFKEECAPPEYKRMHLIYSDPNMSSFAAFLKFGTTHLVLRAFEENNDLLPPVNVGNPIHKMYDFSKDISLTRKVADSRTGKEYTAIQIQREYLNLVLKNINGFSEEENNTLELWQWVLDKLEENPEELYRHLDWVTKLHYLKAAVKDIFSPKGRLFDFLYSDVSENGIYNKLREAGLVEEFVTREEIASALDNPPPTRACLRSRYIRTILDEKHCSWHVDWHLVNENPKFYLNDPFSEHNEELEKFLESLRIKS